MCSPAASPFSLIPLSRTHPLSPPHRTTLQYCFPYPIILSPLTLNPKPSSLSLSATADTNIQFSWDPHVPTREFGGWDIAGAPVQKKEKKGLPFFLLVGIGTSIATVVALLAQSSISSRGLSIKISNPLHSLHGVLSPSRTEKSVEVETSANHALSSGSKDPEVVGTIALDKKYYEKQRGNLGRILFPTALDSTQQEALSVLRRLKIIEEDIKANELCTKREYARWLVRANTVLERNPKHHIIIPAADSGSISAAFDDIHVEDPDFEAIQSLAEAGIVRSRLASKNFGSHHDDVEHEGRVFFFPERFLSRQDLIDWKAQLEYEAVLGMSEKISGSNLGFIDAREISTDASPELFVDMLAGDKSILRRVFGQGKRFQPNKPVTKAQAAVALTSGRMEEAINAEIARLDAENISRGKEMEVIRTELLEKGDIKRFWDKKLEEEKARASEVEKAYLAAIHELEQENICQEKAFAESVKQRAAMECQRELLLSLKEEIREMSKRLTVEKVEYIDELRIVKDLLVDSEGKLEKAQDAKSVLEAEMESLRILRSWIEDETKKTQARVKVLEEVEQRWKWDDRA